QPTSASSLADSTAMDRSSVLLTLTDLGRKKTFEALRNKENFFYERIAQWDNQQLEKFTEMLKAINGFG
ncbi:MarR family transcriptional regulator, partial [Paenibacillus sp. 2TAB19]